MVKNRDEVYKCAVCGNQVEVVFVGGGPLVCCGQPMELQVEKIKEGGWEKHQPVVERKDGGVLVKIGEVEHPMVDEHFIEWVELIVDNGCVAKHFLKPGEAAEAFFPINPDEFQVRAYCNIHGLWKK